MLVIVRQCGRIYSPDAGQARRTGPSEIFRRLCHFAATPRAYISPQIYFLSAPPNKNYVRKTRTITFSLECWVSWKTFSHWTCNVRRKMVSHANFEAHCAKPSTWLLSAYWTSFLWQINFCFASVNMPEVIALVLFPNYNEMQFWRVSVYEEPPSWIDYGTVA